MGTEIELRQMGMSDLTRAGIEVASVEVNAHPATGVHIEVMFPNGYGASVICTPGSYGGRSGLFELAVTDDLGNILPNTVITEGSADHVIGWLDAGEVLDLFRRISVLE